MKIAFRPIPIFRPMSTSNLIRWSGLASVVGGVLLIISDFLELLLVGYDLGEASTTRTYAIVTGLTLLGTVLLLVVHRIERDLDLEESRLEVTPT